MHRFRFLIAVMVLTSAAAASARTFKGDPAHPLTGPSNASAVAIVAQYLRGQGHDGATIGSIVSAANDNTARNGVAHARMEQRISGLRVHDVEIKAALTSRGELIHLIENITAVRGSVRSARADEKAALRAALATLYPTLNPNLAQSGRDGGDTVLFARTAFFHTDPRVTQVLIPTEEGGLAAGYLVETWSQAANLLHETLVSGDGVVLSVELRTNTDSYNVFEKDPGQSTQTVVAGPGPGNAQSPSGWLAGAQNTVNITGNNAHAYLDTDNNGAADAGGTAVNDGNFGSAFNGAAAPSTAGNRNVAIQNLFYLNNSLHDLLYRHGFNEAALNFQENNFGAGGRGSDSVNAEGQDGGGTDNANFSTPRDGQNPRMQMYLWTGKPSHEVLVGATSHDAAGAEFGPALTSTGITDEVAVANDGVLPTGDACEALPAGSLSGFIAVIDRGLCSFVIKVKNAQNAGAVGAIVANNAGDSILAMGGVDATITIPSVFVGQTSGTAIKGASTVTARLKTPAALQRDGDVDSDIVYHEYCHGLTWRMIGTMSGPLAGAIGEGMSDGCALLVNGGDVVAEYSTSDPRGLRSEPYSNYSRTYGDITGSGVHFDGEVYAAIVWKMIDNFSSAGVSKDVLFGYVVDGMNFTPSKPAYEQMRDGILQSVTNRNPGLGHDCLVWRAFAEYGVGVGAKGSVRGSRVVITESFAVPAGCPAP